MAKRGEPLDVAVKLKGFLDVAWCDPRLAAGLNAGEEERVYANEVAIDCLKGIWNPQMTFINEIGETVGDGLNFTIFNGGRAEIQG